MNNMEDKYPKFQWSKFKGASREEQYVVRADTLDELTDAIEALKTHLEESKDVDEVLDEAADATRKCKVCGKQLTRRDGVSKTGKAWAGWFCEDKGHEPQWER